MEVKKAKREYKKVLIRKCHKCGKIGESVIELKNCPSCKKAFLPLNYFEKVHAHGGQRQYESLFAHCDDLEEEELIKGLQVIW